jgi:hypothetical protein
MTVTTPTSTPAATRARVDPRGPRFGAALTTLVLAAALLTLPSAVGLLLLAWQVVVFALGAFVGLSAQPYGRLFARFVRPRLSAPAVLEDAAPPRFAQAVGFTFAALGLVAALSGLTVVAYAAVGAALAAAFLNAVSGLCLGCEMYLLFVRTVRRPAQSP